MFEKIIKSYRTRLMTEGWIKAGVAGLFTGFTAMFLSAMIFWLTGVEQFWLSIVIFGAVMLLTTPIYYFAKYKPSERFIASRIDELGLEERILTMNQLKEDDSYIAKKQREDAMKALNTVNAKLLKIAVSVSLIVCASVSAVAGIGMTTVSGLAASGVLKSGKDIIEEVLSEPVKQYEVEYLVIEGGWIEGEEFQLVDEGKDAIGVMAQAEDEWAFIEWSDGYTEPYREDLNVQSNIKVVALFMPVEEGEGDGEGDGEPDDGPKQPAEPQEGQGNGDPKPGEEGDPNNQAGGKYEPNNQVINGETYYGDEYGNAYEGATEGMSQDGDLSGGKKGAVGDYFGAIQP